MEHLPPVNKPYDPVFVPYVGDREYDGLEFSSYPSRRGYDIERLLQGDFQGSSPEEIAAFLQVWLWFGLIHAVLQVHVDSARFIRTDEAGNKWLNSEFLVLLLQNTGKLIAVEKQQPEYTLAYVEARNHRIDACLHTTYHVWEGFSRLEANYSVPNPMSAEVSFGIQVLAISLHVGATQLLIKPDSPDSVGYRSEAPWEKSLHIRLTRSPWLEARMVKQGWCPLYLEQIRSHTNVLGQYYSSLIGPPHRKLDHSKCSKSARDCLAMEQHQILSVGHETENCSCEILLVDKTKLQDIITNNEIPVLRLVEVDGENVLDVVSSTSVPGLEYTAMSHVWSDGWGNPNENSLPACRVEKLVNAIRATYTMPDFDVTPAQGGWFRAEKHDDSVYFWIDTLCVPREPSHIHSRAIMQMREVYMHAERVLVFDSELMASTAEANYEELNMRVKCSRWIRRLWTLQEAVLAQRLIFQFKERPHMFMTGSLLWHARQKDLKLNYYNSIGWDCDTTFHIMDKLDGPKSISFLWILLISDRSVTVQADEPLCGSILMDFDMKRLMEAPDSRRMQVYWQLHNDGLPLAILFVAGPRILEPGYRWAPTSLLPCEKAGIRFSETGRATDEGFRIRIPAYSVFTVTAPGPITEPCFPLFLDGAKYFVRKSPVKNNPSWAGLELHKRKDIALIIELLPTEDEDGTRAMDGSRAGLVSITSRTPDLITAEYLNLVSVIREGTSYHKYPSIPWTEGEVEHGERSPCQGEWIGEEIEWCIT